MTGERELCPWREDTKTALSAVFEEHGLGEAEVSRDRLAFLLRHLVTAEEYAEGVTAGSPFADEDLQDV
jgi:hypothetical protein